MLKKIQMKKCTRKREDSDRKSRVGHSERSRAAGHSTTDDNDRCHVMFTPEVRFVFVVAVDTTTEKSLFVAGDAAEPAVNGASGLRRSSPPPAGEWGDSRSWKGREHLPRLDHFPLFYKRSAL